MGAVELRIVVTTLTTQEAHRATQLQIPVTANGKAVAAGGTNAPHLALVARTVVLDIKFRNSAIDACKQATQPRTCGIATGQQPATQFHATLLDLVGVVEVLPAPPGIGVFCHYAPSPVTAKGHLQLHVGCQHHVVEQVGLHSEQRTEGWVGLWCHGWQPASRQRVGMQAVDSVGMHFAKGMRHVLLHIVNLIVGMTQQREGNIQHHGIVLRIFLLDKGQLVVRIAVAVDNLEQRGAVGKHGGSVDEGAQTVPVLSHMGSLEERGRHSSGNGDVARHAAGATAGQLVVLDKGTFRRGIARNPDAHDVDVGIVAHAVDGMAQTTQFFPVVAVVGKHLIAA